MAKILPAIFFGHGNPMNAVLDNAYTKAWNVFSSRTNCTESWKRSSAEIQSSILYTRKLTV